MASRRLNSMLKDRRFIMRWSMIFGFLLAMSFILPKNYVVDFSYEQGKLWVDPDLKAQFDFPVFKAPGALEAQRRKAAAEAISIFSTDTLAENSSRREVAQAVDGFFEKLEEYKNLLGSNVTEAEEYRQETFIPLYNLDPLSLLQENSRLEVWKKNFSNKLQRFLDDVYAIYLLDTSRIAFNRDMIGIQLRSNRRNLVEYSTVLVPDELDRFLEKDVVGLSTDEVRIFDELILPRLQPNLRYDERLSEDERELAENRILPVSGIVSQGEIIIMQDERVEEEQDMKLKSYFKARSERLDQSPYFETFISQLVMMAMLTFLMLLIMRNNRPRVFFSVRKMGLVLLLIFIMMAIVVLILKLTFFTVTDLGVNYIFLAPVCMVSIILTAFFDARFGFFSNFVMALFVASIVPNGFEFFFVQVCAGSVAVYSLTRLRSRSDFFLTMVMVLLAYSVAFIGYSFYAKGSFLNIQYGNLILFGLNIVLTFITYPLIYLFEKYFGLTSDLTYIELLDTNHPLLKELSLKAPGTFQHSMQVANLAEAVLNRIGGNSLQARVGALFHDIGKMKNPQFFIENLGEDDSPHGKLDNKESAAVIIAHVTDGIKMGQEHGLPNEIIKFIKTHHGTTKTEFFYRKYVEEHPDEKVSESDFSYPGPVPQSREMAVMMIADSCEAAARSMKEHSREKLSKLVEGIVSSKVRQHQFDRTNLTFKDLQDAKTVILNQLVSMYHARIEYPDEQPEPQN